MSRQARIILIALGIMIVVLACGVCLVGGIMILLTAAEGSALSLFTPPML